MQCKCDNISNKELARKTEKKKELNVMMDTVHDDSGESDTDLTFTSRH